MISTIANKNIMKIANVSNRYEFIANSLEEKNCDKAKDAVRKTGKAVMSVSFNSHKYSSAVLYVISRFSPLH